MIAAFKTLTSTNSRVHVGLKSRNHCNNLQSKHLTTIKLKLPGKQIGKPRVFFVHSAGISFPRLSLQRCIFYSTTQVKGKRVNCSYSFLKKQNRTKRKTLTKSVDVKLKSSVIIFLTLPLIVSDLNRKK